LFYSGGGLNGKDTRIEILRSASQQQKLETTFIAIAIAK
jgi:hypothetical protein